MHAAHHDDVGIGFGSLLCQSEAIAHIVGNVLNFAFGVVMRQNDGIFFLAKASDFGLHIYMGR